jgi:hypothetical protein
MSRDQSVVFRDLVIFQVKLVLDGLKDIVLMPASIIAAGLDLLSPGRHPGHRFYAVMRLGERYDRWLSLFAAAEKAARTDDGLFGVDRADPNSMLGRIEAMMLDDEEAARRASSMR